MTIPYQPVGQAKEVFLSDDRELIIAGGAGTGKSRANLEKMHACALKFPLFRGLLTRKTRSSMTNTTLVTLENHVVPPGFFGEGGAGRANRTVYQYPNGSEIDIVGLDKADRIMSSEYDMIQVSECTEVTQDDWEKCKTRLRNGRMGYHQILGDCNPDAPTHWIKVREAGGLVRVLESKLSDNPRYHDGADWTQEGVEYLITLGDLTGHRRDRLLYGKWCSPEGARWPDLNREQHTFRMKDKWPDGLPVTYDVIIGIDYGIRAPYCALWVAIDHDGDLWVFREDYEPGFGAWEQAQRVVNLTGGNERVRCVFADPSCWSEMIDQGGRTGVSTADYYSRAFTKDDRFGPLLKGFNKSRRNAMDTIDLLLARDNGERNLYIEEHCVNLWKELSEAVWDARTGAKEDLDQSCADHAITSLYYAVHTYINPSTPAKPIFPPQEEIARLRVKEINDESYKRFNKRCPGINRRRLRV